MITNINSTSKLLEKEMRIADMGCGMGKSTHSLASVFGRTFGIWPIQ